MPEVSLTIFIDYLLSTASRRLTRIQDWIAHPDYERAFDYWGPLRDWIVEAEKGRLSNADIRARVKRVTDSKRARYEHALAGYAKFSKRNGAKHLPAPRSSWQYGDLTIRVNPELAYDIGGQRVCVKLYFRAERISSDKAALIGEIMRSSLPDFEPRVLDVKSGRLIVPRTIEHMDLLLKAEARSFSEIWRGLHSARIPDDLRKPQQSITTTRTPTPSHRRSVVPTS